MTAACSCIVPKRVAAHLNPDKQEAPRIMSSPAKEKSVSPKLASNSPAQITKTTNTFFNVIASNLNTTAQNRILERYNSSHRYKRETQQTEVEDGQIQ